MKPQQILIGVLLLEGFSKVSLISIKSVIIRRHILYRKTNTMLVIIT